MMMVVAGRKRNEKCVQKVEVSLTAAKKLEKMRPLGKSETSGLSSTNTDASV